MWGGALEGVTLGLEIKNQEQSHLAALGVGRGEAGVEVSLLVVGIVGVGSSGVLHGFGAKGVHVVVEGCGRLRGCWVGDSREFGVSIVMC